ncbi:unnamed protein product [Cylicocyclus nassatus]|uniref:C-type lectin domain-containing protein n=1 Tax=Cylicocyclus nassatus TaxID=53992 RepID=A0AA36M628_CYLNA|nr:unnamed protein product [Cylicocyclus nassatus]
MVSLQINIIWLLIASSSWEQDLPPALCSFDALPVNESFYASKNVVYNISNKQDCYRLCYEDDECSYLEYKDGECIIYHEATSANEDSLNANSLDSVYKLTRDNRESKPCQIVASKLTRSLPQTNTTGPDEKTTPTSQTVQRSCYKAFKSKKSAIEAEDICNKYRGHLASIHSDKVNDLLTGWSKSVEGREILIGLMFKKTLEKYWLDGSEMHYEKWREGEPSHSEGQEYCTAVTSEGTWNDVKCTDNFSFACVVPPDACAKA